MAKNFSVEVLISTAKAVKDLHAAEGQVRVLDRSLANLSKTLKESNGNLDAAAKSIGSIVASSRDAAKASESLAAAKIKSSRADANALAVSERSAVNAAREGQALAGKSANLALATSRTDANTRAGERHTVVMRQAASATDAMGNSLSNQRYLLYDVGATYRTLALAAQALPAASVAVATSYEKSFAQVIRTSGATGEAVGVLKQELKTLGTEIPMTFSELSNIAKIGGQMDVPAESLAKFTEVVATFVATADGVTIDKATESFGRMANLFASDMSASGQADFFERLGSAISYTADNSVTSEAKISAMLEKIAPIGKSAGLSAVEITSFASALSSVGLAPEISSGFLTRFFGGMNKDIAGNTKTLQVYNEILGTTNDEFKAMYESDPSGVLTNIVTELSKLDKVSQTKLLGDLGVSGVRDIRVIQGLAQNLHVLEKAQKDTAEAFNKGTYLKESSAGIFNTFAANLQKFTTALSNLGETMGSGLLNVLNPLVQTLGGLVSGFNDLLNQYPALKGLFSLLMTVGSIIGVWAAFKSAQAFVTAGLIGFTHAVKSGVAGTMTFSGQLTRVAELMLLNKGYTDAQTAALLRQVSGLKAVQTAMTATTAGTVRLNNAQFAGVGIASRFAGGMKTVGSSLLGFVGGPIGAAITGLSLLGIAWFNSAQDAKQAANEMVEAAGQGEEALAQWLGKSFATDKVGVFDADSLKLVGKTYQEVAQIAGVSLEDIKKALSGTSQDLDEYIRKTRESRNALVDSGQASALDDQGRALGQLLTKLESYKSGMVDAENTTKAATEANGGHSTSVDRVGESYDSSEEKVVNWTSKLNDAVAAAFGMVDAQGALESSLEKLGAGLQKSGSFGTDSGDGRSNLANLQATLQAQALLLQQNIQAGEISAEQASVTYGNFVTGLMDQLIASGVDPEQIKGVAQQASNSVQEVFDGQVIEIPLSVNDQEFLDNTIYSYSTVADFLAENELTATLSADPTPAEQQAWDLVNYLSEVMGMPFESVLTAFGDPASKEAELVGTYMNDVMGLNYQAAINADTSNAVSNVNQFGNYATSVLATVGNYLADFGASIANTGIPGVSSLGRAIQDLGSFVGGINFGAPEMVKATQAAKQAVPQYKSANQAGREAGKAIGRGFDEAAKKTSGAGKAAKKTGNAAKKAGAKGKKAGKDLGKAAKDAKKDWDEAEQAISGYASRIGTAFGYVFDKTQGVDVAKDEYYSVLNGIKERLEAQKQTLKDLRAENKALNAERQVELNDAAKLEKMAKYADAMGNTERAKVYRDEAKALKASAAETKNKVDANNAEAKAIEKGMGNLKGYSQAAIENRAEIRRLEQASLAVATAYAKSGSSASTVARETANWTAKSKTHSVQLGYTRKDVENVTSKTSAYISMLNRVPKTITTNVNENKKTNLTATNNTGSGVSAANRSLGSIPSNKNTNVKVGSSGIPKVQGDLGKIPKTVNTTVKVIYTGQLRTPDGSIINLYSDGSRKNTGLKALNRGGAVGSGTRGFASGGKIPGTPPSNPREDNLLAKVDGKGMVAVRSGEYIQRQEAVDYYGSDIMDKMNKMEIPRYALGGMLGNSNNITAQMGGVIELGAESIQTLARLVEKEIYLYAGLEEIANSVNKGNLLIAQKGGHGVPK